MKTLFLRISPSVYKKYIPCTKKVVKFVLDVDCRVSAAKIYLYHSTEIAKARPHSEGIFLKIMKILKTDFF